MLLASCKERCCSERSLGVKQRIPFVDPSGQVEEGEGPNAVAALPQRRLAILKVEKGPAKVRVRATSHRGEYGEQSLAHGHQAIERARKRPREVESSNVLHICPRAYVIDCRSYDHVIERNTLTPNESK